MRRCAHIKAQAWNPSQRSIEIGCIFPSNQSAGPQRMCWLPSLCHPVSAWAPTVNPPTPRLSQRLHRSYYTLKESPMQEHGLGRWRRMIPHSGKHCLSKCVLLANAPHVRPHDWLIIFKTTASDLPSANPTQQGFSSLSGAVSLAELSFLSVRQKVRHVLCIARSCWSSDSSARGALWSDPQLDGAGDWPAWRISLVLGSRCGCSTPASTGRGSDSRRGLKQREDEMRDCHTAKTQLSYHIFHYFNSIQFYLYGATSQRMLLSIQSRYTPNSLALGGHLSLLSDFLQIKQSCS